MRTLENLYGEELPHVSLSSDKSIPVIMVGEATSFEGCS